MLIDPEKRLSSDEIQSGDFCTDQVQTRDFRADEVKSGNFCTDEIQTCDGVLLQVVAVDLSCAFHDVRD